MGSQCLDCAKAGRPPTATRVRHAASGVLTPVTYVLIAANVAVFVWMTIASSRSLSGGLTAEHARLGLSKGILRYGVQYLDGSIGGPHEWWRLVTAGFIHFGVFHLLMNMLLLYQLGMLLERAVGSTRLALMYTASLLAGSLGVLVVDSGGITGGASGAVFGLMAGAAIGLHRRGVNVFSTGIGTTLLINLVLTFTISGISIGGHLGGVVGGTVCGWVMLAPPWRPLPKWAGWATPVAVALVSVVLSVAVVG